MVKIAVEVEGEAGKTVERRIVDLPENCIKWTDRTLKNTAQ